MNLTMAMLRSSLVGIVLLGLLLFLPAGTLDYWRGWFFLVLFTVMTSVLGLYLARHDPALLERRIRAGPAAETRPAQKRIIRILLLLSVAIPVLCALDRRFGWSSVPPVLTIVGGALVVAGLLIDLRVFRENSFGASTIRIMAEQRVISTGPYALVRHPMYSGALVMIMGTPPSLGSWWGLLLVPPCFLLLAWRIADEEAMLRQDLAGYADYTARVRSRLVPGLW